MKNLFGFLLLGTLLCLLASASLAQAPAQPIVQDARAQGFKNVSPETRQQVDTIITGLKGQAYDKARVSEAAQAILDLGLFYPPVNVSQEPANDGINLIFSIRENPVVKAIKFSGNVTFTDEQLRKYVTVTPDTVFNQNEVLSSAMAITEAYIKDDYRTSGVLEPQMDFDTGELTFVIIEPRINEVRITGNTRTREYVIRRQLAFEIGDILNFKKHEQSLRNLYQLGIFQEPVTINYEPGTSPGALLATVDVKERRTGMAGVGIAQGEQSWTGFINLADTNLFGTGQRLSLNLRIGGEDSYQVSYSNPWVDNHRTNATVNIYDRSILREAMVDTSSTTTDSYRYDEQRTGGNITFGRPINPNTRLLLGMRVDNISGKAEDTIPDNVKSLILQKSEVRSLSLTGIQDSRNNFARPTGSFLYTLGSYSSLGAEFAGLGGVNFSKLTADLRQYLVVKKDSKAAERIETMITPRHWVYATRVMGGVSTGVPPFLDQFMLGGADTLRGYRLDRFPGENMVLWNNELRVPVTDSLTAVGFFDAGSAWGGQFAETFGDADFKLRYGYGLGIRVQLPAVGPLRLDYGINDEGTSEFTFGVGTTF